MQELIKALILAQSELKNIQTDSMNPHFKNKYASLAACLDATREILAKHGLVVVQTCKVQDNAVVCVTSLWHSSGQSLVSEYPVITQKPDAQGYGSGLSYARRYSLLSILNLAQEDDDGNSTQRPLISTKNNFSTGGMGQTKKTSDDTVLARDRAFSGDVSRPTEPQLRRLYAISKQSGWDEARVNQYLADMGLASTKDLNYVQYEHMCKAMLDHPMA